MSYLIFESLKKLNRAFSHRLIPHLINETFLSNLHAALEPYQELGGAYAWLLHARLTEAALLCAGHYADNCEFSAAGDLLVNPRCVRLYDKADPTRSKTKIRHMALSRQFKKSNELPEDFRRRFSDDMVLRIEAPALLPMLLETLRRAGVFRDRYLESVVRRMEKIADTIAFLMAWPVDTIQQLEQRLIAAPADSRRFMEANLCRFDRRDFNALGAELQAMEGNRFSTSAFLNNAYTESIYPISKESVNERTIPVDKRMPFFV